MSYNRGVRGNERQSNTGDTTMNENDVGKTGKLYIEKLTVSIHIREIRYVWGRTDVLVSPVNGSGRQWVSADRVKLDDIG